jgi:hypothetical protein
VPHDRWAIAAYIRALQLSQHAPALLAAGKSMEQSTAKGSEKPGAEKDGMERK